MKTNLFAIVGIASALAFASCSPKTQPVAGAGDYEYQQWLAQKRASERGTTNYPQQVAQAPTQTQQYAQQPQQYAQQPKAVLRESNPTIDYALEESNHLRSFGSATGYIESVLYDQAIISAQERMSVLLQSELASVASNYLRNANKNLDNTSATLYESVTKRFAINTSKDVRIAKYSVYDLDNGQVRVYVCIETKPDNHALSTQLANELSHEGFLGLQFDRDRFIKENEQGLKEYRERLFQSSETNP